MFTPKIKISNVNADSSKWTVEDITGTSPTDPTGYGQAGYLPANSGVWTKQVTAQYLGALPAVVPFTSPGDELLVSAELSYQLQDGVYLITEYFAVPFTGLQYTVDVTKRILTRTGGNPWVDPLGTFAGVHGVMKGVFTGYADLSQISSVSATTLTLTDAINTLVTNDNLTVVYKASKYILITSAGSKKLLSAIGDMALAEFSPGNCDTQKSAELFNHIALKSAIAIHFNCGNYSKAHNGAVLLNQLPAISDGCSSC
jgi:hypothetical protein